MQDSLLADIAFAPPPVRPTPASRLSVRSLTDLTDPPAMRFDGGSLQQSRSDDASSREMAGKGAIAVLSDTLATARRLVQENDLAQARLVCAAFVFAQQPRLATNAALCAETIETLVLARAFPLLSRLLRALHGRLVRFDLAGPIECASSGLLVRAHREGGTEVVTFSESVFCHPAGAAAIAQWSRRAAT